MGEITNSNQTVKILVYPRGMQVLDASIIDFIIERKLKLSGSLYTAVTPTLLVLINTN